MKKKYINFIPMPCVNCHKVSKMPEYSLYCLDCRTTAFVKYPREAEERSRRK